MRLLALAITTSLLSLPAFADPARPRTADARRMVTDDCALARKAGKACEISIPAEDVGGSMPGPGDITVRVLPPGTQTSLIRIRRDFIVEIVKSAEDL